MNGLGDIPRYIRYDFLITFLGFLFLGTWWYFKFTKNMGGSGVDVLFIISIPFIFWGLGEMYNNYRDERDLLQIKTIIEKKKIFDEMENEKIISTDKKKFLIEILKKEMETLVKEKEDK